MSERVVKVLEKLKISCASGIELLQGGFHSVAAKVSHDGACKVVKVIGNKPELTQLLNAQGLAQKIIRYFELLVEAGVRVPGPIKVDIVHNGNTYDVVMIMPYTGKNAEELMLGSSVNEHILGLSANILDMVKPLLGNGHVDGEKLKLDIGIELKPSNVTVDGDGQLYYVDLMPPRFSADGETFVEFSPPKSKEGFRLAYFRNFDVRGILLLLQDQFSRLRPDLRPEFKKLILQFVDGLELPGIGRIKNFFVNGVWEKVFWASTKKAHRIISSLGPRDMYAFREIACEAVHRYPDLYRKDDLEGIFGLTHFYEDVPNLVDIAKAKKTIGLMVRGKPLNS